MVERGGKETTVSTLFCPFASELSGHAMSHSCVFCSVSKCPVSIFFVSNTAGAVEDG